MEHMAAYNCHFWWKKKHSPITPQPAAQDLSVRG